MFFQHENWPNINHSILLTYIKIYSLSREISVHVKNEILKLFRCATHSLWFFIKAIRTKFPHIINNNFFLLPHVKYLLFVYTTPRLLIVQTVPVVLMINNYYFWKTVIFCLTDGREFFLMWEILIYLPSLTSTKKMLLKEGRRSKKQEVNHACVGLL